MAKDRSLHRDIEKITALVLEGDILAQLTQAGFSLH
jgi:hypothetical protein